MECYFNSHKYIDSIKIKYLNLTLNVPLGRMETKICITLDNKWTIKLVMS